MLTKHELETTSNSQKSHVDQLVEDRQKQALEIDNLKTELSVRENRLLALDSMITRVSKELSEANTHVAVIPSQLGKEQDHRTVLEGEQA